jgi:hypothetical protein
MLSGPPLPLPSACPLGLLLPLIQGRKQVGAWVRGSRRELRLHVHSAGQASPILLSRDLGYLLRQCCWVAVRIGKQAVVLAAEELIRCRALQVVTGTPYLPSAERLMGIFPEIELGSAGFSIPIQHQLPEEVLSLCLTHGIPVAESRIDYRRTRLTGPATYIFGRAPGP